MFLESLFAILSGSHVELVVVALQDVDSVTLKMFLHLSPYPKDRESLYISFQQAPAVRRV